AQRAGRGVLETEGLTASPGGRQRRQPIRIDLERAGRGGICNGTMVRGRVTMNDPDRHGSSLSEPVDHHRATTSRNEPVADESARKMSTEHEKR
ncbi:MAG: hypothetical protein WC343_10000, partial [Bacilli bacterium]